MAKFGDMMPTDPLAKALGLGNNLFINSDTPGLGGKKDSNSADAVTSEPVPTPQAPVSSAAADVIAAQQDFAKQNLMKKSVKKTIYAGDTGGFKAPQPAF